MNVMSDVRLHSPGGASRTWVWATLIVLSILGLGGVIIAIGLFASAVLSLASQEGPSQLPFDRPFSEPLRMGDRTSSTGGLGTDTIAFSPDGEVLAYLWHNGIRRYSERPREMPLMLTESVEIRWFDVGRPDEVRTTLVDEIDLRPSGAHYNITARLLFSPDSRHLAVVSPKRLIIIELATGDSREIPLEEEETFRELAWRSSDVPVYAILRGRTETFFRHQFKATPSERQLVYEAELDWVAQTHHQPDGFTLPPGLQEFDWSPDGRLVLIRRRAQQGQPVALLDIDTGTITPLSNSISSVMGTSWSNNGAHILIRGSSQPHTYGDVVVLVDTRTGQATDMAERFSTLVGSAGSPPEVHLPSPVWVDANHMIVHDMSWNREPGAVNSHLVRLEPWGVVLSTRRYLRPSPVAGWLLLQGGESFDWIDPARAREVHLEGWPNQWVWAPGGRHAAEIRDDEIVLLQPTTPPTTALPKT